ncbi:uncharacterized protein LOC131242206 [Magnolia sinica]|uniref:uncharacterized protein LOC131242206 n=1 Tax=Magnolia sinica TaxID=86752 RepID=UPI0026581DCE|nr:uncharacterized protein LOC131242206 [Magnolia sinica]XP_058096691.1 uncharacterized protein LOC131242206 [Magnolia sinica]XP_058096693.1 uncharacterized protein LOC131242206 [Magnolia sinica]XP_058096694.1 uncharacterized protein LOC131242206 [Magnolia sinica]XP_058096695.1 uncharacterized protein LOC131242206 [Magnolia sinica]XP_058096696.1 uncharacterized protein LOC131242206 [Magnolia sinica]XP_058096697.1 uncharacterized protein LOC131242206 [Magnolia sinica]XP_058096698.1 uncharacte
MDLPAAAAAEDPSPSFSDPLSSSSIDPFSCNDLATLQDLASRGSWLALLDKLSDATATLQPHEHLIYLSFNALALFKLRRFSDASRLLIDLDLEDSDAEPDPRHRFESYPNLYPNRSGSMLPFALRWLYADLPHRLGNRSESLDRLYRLLAFIRRRKLATEAFQNSVWDKREMFVVNSIVSNHLAYKEFSVCLCLLQDQLRSKPSDPVLLSKAAYIYMQIGDLEEAKSVFTRIEGLAVEGKEFQNLVNRNRALVYLVGKDYVSAVREYEECIERDPADVVAFNNKALCLMYLRDLSDSIKVLEGALERVPTAALNETVVVNLCSMYELAFVNHSEIKKTLSNWIARVAPDDFNSSCTRT